MNVYIFHKQELRRRFLELFVYQSKNNYVPKTKRISKEILINHPELRKTYL